MQLGFKVQRQSSTVYRGARLARRKRSLMKRFLATAALVLGIATFVKLTLKPRELSLAERSGPTSSAELSASVPSHATYSGAGATLSEKYRSEPADVRALVARVAERFGRNALLVDNTDGLHGLVLLDRLDLEAIFLYEKHPAEFRRLRDSLGDNAAGDLLLHWREYFGFKRADDADRGVLIAEIANLTPALKRMAARYPSALPLILADPPDVTDFIDRIGRDEKKLADTLAVLCFVSLERGPSDLRSALRTFDQHGSLALEAFRRHGLEGFALVKLYGPVLEALGNSLPLDQSLILLRVNADYIDELLQTHRPETVAGHLRHVAAAGLTDLVGDSPQALRLVVEYGRLGETALRHAGPDAADVVFGDFNDAILRQQAVTALSTHGQMALAMLEKYASDGDFCDILRTRGAAVIPPIAQSDASPEVLAHLGAKSQRSFTESLALAALFASGDNGQATIHTIKKDGLARVEQLNQSNIQFYQFLPLYDVIHLGNVMRQGYAPTGSEMTWALVDGCFAVADVVSLAAVQPEGAIAAESIRTEVKAAVREGAKSVGRELAENGAESGGKSLARHELGIGLERAGAIGPKNLSRRWARWWTVRKAGGFYQVLRQAPEALPRLSLQELTTMAGPLASKAGMRLTTWGPIRLLRDGAEVVLRIPPQRGLKYVSAQAIQAGVGLIAIQKIEEHLASHRPHSAETRP
jgi:hypothetical protein